jgi:hypothetical protein
MYGEIRTANVIYSRSGRIFKITSFNGNEEGRKLATLHFCELIRKYSGLFDYKVEDFIMEGACEIPNYSKDVKIHLIVGDVPYNNA